MWTPLCVLLLVCLSCFTHLPCLLSWQSKACPARRLLRRTTRLRRARPLTHGPCPPSRHRPCRRACGCCSWSGPTRWGMRVCARWLVGALPLPPSHASTGRVLPAQHSCPQLLSRCQHPLSCFCCTLLHHTHTRAHTHNTHTHTHTHTYKTALHTHASTRRIAFAVTGIQCYYRILLVFLLKSLSDCIEPIFFCNMRLGNQIITITLIISSPIVYALFPSVNTLYCLKLSIIIIPHLCLTNLCPTHCGHAILPQTQVLYVCTHTWIPSTVLKKNPKP